MGYFGSDHDVTFDSDLFPRQGRTEEEVMARLDAFAEQDVDEVSGHSIVYGTQLMSHMDAARISKLANMKFIKKNMLYKELMPGTERMALETKRMIVEMLGYPDDVRIRFTSGGSESLYCGINAAYQWCRRERPEIEKPEIVAPHSIHAAVSKWCHYTGLRLKRVPLGPDHRADVGAMERALFDEPLRESLRHVNWTAPALAATIVGLDLGFLLLYRAGFELSLAQIVTQSSAAVLLIGAGVLVFRERLTLANVAGIVLCVAGLWLISRR